MSSRAVSLDQTLDIETPELAIITYSIAGIGARVKAAIIDQLICIGTWLGIMLLFAVTGLKTKTALGAWAGAVVVLLELVIVSGYYILFEGLRDGQTPGKRIAGIRVVKDGGFSVSFGASATRNILRLVDMQPAFVSAVGLITIAFSKTGKRIGDMVAGTIVVREQTVKAHVEKRFGLSSLVESRRPPARFESEESGSGEASPPVASVLTEPEFSLLERYVLRRSALPPEERAKMVALLTKRFRGRIAHEQEGHPIFLLDLYEKESRARRAGVASRGSTGAARERHAIVSEGRARWAAFANRVAEIRRTGLDKVSEKELNDFVGAYRETAGDLARLRTASHGADPSEVFYLSRVVAAGHNLFYRAATYDIGSVGRYLFHEVPAEVLRSWRPVALSALLFFGPVAIAYSSVRARPQTAEALVGSGMIARAEEGVERAKKGTGYIEDFKEERPLMGSFIIRNNINVALLAVAGGVTLIGTPVVLMTNGISIGAVLGLYANKNILPLIFGFVIPHSALELSAITIAGAGGLLLSLALLAPGMRTRREALKAMSERALKLVSCAAFFLLFAGSLEGLVSPNPHLSTKEKLMFSLASILLMVVYISLGSARVRPEPLSPDIG